MAAPSYPILDLRTLKNHPRKYKIKMLTLKVLSHFICPKNWLTLVDLKKTENTKFLKIAYYALLTVWVQC